ncbi:hypothetical protein [Promicromonospora sp. NPDC023987]|uniref:hypothetical protein n=1 Tax=Promicromonospora sp. NPDC023987 TaxID=3155360 RepID=UPI00340BC9E8
MSTTCLALALTWPRPALLLEADPRGVSALMTGWFQGARPYTTGLVELALSSLAPVDALQDVSSPFEGTQASFVVGLRTHTQAPTLRGQWEPIAQALAELDAEGTDVIVDAGALGYPGSPDPVLASADLTLLTVRSSLPAIGGARPWADVVVREDRWRHPGLLLVGENRPYASREVAGALGLPVLAQVAWDPDGAEYFSQGARQSASFHTSKYIRSLNAAVETLQAVRANHRALEVHA